MSRTDDGRRPRLGGPWSAALDSRRTPTVIASRDEGTSLASWVALRPLNQQGLRLEVAFTQLDMRMLVRQGQCAAHAPHHRALLIALALGGGLLACVETQRPAEPWIVVQPDSAMMTLPEGAGGTASAAVAVTNDGPGTLSALTDAISYGETPTTGWLTGTLSGPTAPATLMIQFSAGTLSAGSYAAAVVVRSPDAANDSAVVHVVCTVTVPQCTLPVMCLSTTRVTFTAEAGGLSVAEPVGVYSCGCGRVTGLSAGVTYEEPGQPEWLSVKKNSWRTPAALSIQAAPALLQPGSYHGVVVVSADSAANSPQTVNVVLEVR
jgi:hypothetical protein